MNPRVCSKQKLKKFKIIVFFVVKMLFRIFLVPFKKSLVEDFCKEKAWLDFMCNRDLLEVSFIISSASEIVLCN